jgi:hypothetical protein
MFLCAAVAVTVALAVTVVVVVLWLYCDDIDCGSSLETLS